MINAENRKSLDCCFISNWATVLLPPPASSSHTSQLSKHWGHISLLSAQPSLSPLSLLYNSQIYNTQYHFIVLCCLSFPVIPQSFHADECAWVIYIFPQSKSNGSPTPARLYHFHSIKHHFVLPMAFYSIFFTLISTDIRLGMSLVSVMNQHTNTHTPLLGSICGSHDNNNGHTGRAYTDHRNVSLQRPLLHLSQHTWAPTLLTHMIR